MGFVGVNHVGRRVAQNAPKGGGCVPAFSATFNFDHRHASFASALCERATVHGQQLSVMAVLTQSPQCFERLALAAAPFCLEVNVEDFHARSERRASIRQARRLTNPARAAARIGHNSDEYEQ